MNQDRQSERELSAQDKEYQRARRVRAWISLLFLAPGLAMLVYLAVTQLALMFR